LETEVPWPVDGVNMFADNFPKYKKYTKKNKRIYFCANAKGNDSKYVEYSFKKMLELRQEMLLMQAKDFSDNVSIDDSLINYTSDRRFDKYLGKNINEFKITQDSRIKLKINLSKPVFLNGVISSDSPEYVKNLPILVSFDNRIIAVCKAEKYSEVNNLFGVMLPNRERVFHKTKLFFLSNGVLIQAKRLLSKKPLF